MSSSTSVLHKTIDYFVEHPKKLFLVDGIGAIVSAFLLGVVLAKFESVVGIPRSTLFILASVPIIFALYDFIIYSSSWSEKKSLLKAIAVANSMYIVLSLVFAFIHVDEVTALGWTYVILEIAVLLMLIYVEFAVAQKH